MGPYMPNAFCVGGSMCPAVPTKLPAPTKPGAGVVIALPTAAFACIAAPEGELPTTPVVLSAPSSPPPSILFIIGDPAGPTCSEFIPSALPWLLGPCPWLFPGIIASNYTTRGAQPLRYHAKIQQDLITTTSRAPNVARGRLNSASSV